MSNSRDDGSISRRVLTVVSIKAVIEFAFIAALVGYGATQTFHPFQRGALDIVGPDRITGWAYDPTDTSNPLRVQLFIDNKLFAEAAANEVRIDLVEAGAAPRPEHGFSFDLKKNGIEAGTHYAQVYGVRTSLGATLSLVPLLKQPVRFEVP
jgi:hypothetical protein